MIDRRVVVLSLLALLVAFFAGTVVRNSNSNSDDNDNGLTMSANDPYFSMAQFNAFYPLAAMYTLVSHAWLLVVNRRGGEKNTIPMAHGEEIGTKKLAIVTGSNTGIGFEVSKRLVREFGYDVILACRSKDKALIARDKINNSFDNDTTTNNSKSRRDDKDGETTKAKAIVLDQVLDLSDFGSVRKFADAIQKNYDNVDVLINNAGRSGSGRSPGNPNLNVVFQSNYLGHFLLTELMLKKKLLSNNSNTNTNITGNNKVINLSSVMHHFSKGDKHKNEYESIASPDYWRRRALYSDGGGDDDEKGDIVVPNVYAASKLAAILHSLELNRRYGDNRLISIAVNPGAVNSDIWRRMPTWIRKHVFERVLLTVEQGSEPIIAAVVRNDLVPDKDGIVYIQPYANPFAIFGGRWFPDSSRADAASASLATNQGPMLPFTEMLGPYVGHLVSTARLPRNKAEAAETLWRVSKELTES